MGGGDGTQAWGLRTVDKARELARFEYIYGVIPLGTGNDVSRALGWRGKYPGTKCLLRYVTDIVTSENHSLLDRWDVKFFKETTNGLVESNFEASHISEMIAYLSIGTEAEIMYDFTQEREKHPWWFSNRFR